MIQLVVRHQVGNFEQWHGFYKKFAALRARYGVRSEQVFQAIDDPCNVTLIHAFDTLVEVQTILASTEIQAALAEAGVVGAPSAWIVKAVD
jgi:hypothetical protein